MNQDDQVKLRSGVAKLLFIATRVRPDILLPVNYLCSRANKFNEDDYKKFIHILEYLNKDSERGIILRRSENLMINVYADASFGCHKEDCFKSHSGLVIQVGNSTIYSKTSKQKIVTTSSTEAELVCASDAIPIVYYIRDWLLEKNVEIIQVNLMQDNLSTIQLINNGNINSLRSKHISIKYHAIREKVRNGEIKIQHCSTDKMIADALTKPLHGQQFRNLKDKILGEE